MAAVSVKRSISRNNFFKYMSTLYKLCSSPWTSRILFLLPFLSKWFYPLISFNYWHRTQTRACKDRLASLDVTESMDIMGYQAATAEMVQKEKRAWQVPLDHVVWREKWDQVEQILITGTGNSARGRLTMVVILDWLRLVDFCCLWFV